MKKTIKKSLTAITMIGLLLTGVNGVANPNVVKAEMTYKTLFKDVEGRESFRQEHLL